MLLFITVYYSRKPFPTTGLSVAHLPSLPIEVFLFPLISRNTDLGTIHAPPQIFPKHSLY